MGIVEVDAEDEFKILYNLSPDINTVVLIGGRKRGEENIRVQQIRCFFIYDQKEKNRCTAR